VLCLSLIPRFVFILVQASATPLCTKVLQSPSSPVGGVSRQLTAAVKHWLLLPPKGTAKFSCGYPPSSLSSSFAIHTASSE